MDLSTFILGIGVAFLIGSALGVERQFHQHPVGLRTTALVCVGAARFVSLSRLMGHDASPTRIAAFETCHRLAVAGPVGSKEM